MIATQENANATAAQAPVARRLYTYEELAAELPETNQPCELWDGELVKSPAPSFYHQEIALRFYRRLHDLERSSRPPSTWCCRHTGPFSRMWPTSPRSASTLSNA